MPALRFSGFAVLLQHATEGVKKTSIDAGYASRIAGDLPVELTLGERPDA